MLGEESAKCENIIQFLKGQGIRFKKKYWEDKTLNKRKDNYYKHFQKHCVFLPGCSVLEQAARERHRGPAALPCPGASGREQVSRALFSLGKFPENRAFLNAGSAFCFHGNI